MADEDGIASVADSRLVSFRQTDGKTHEAAGEVEYVNEHVLSGAGFRFIASEAIATWEAKRLVYDVKAHEAVHLARSIIAAADKISETLPLPSGNGIGGPGGRPNSSTCGHLKIPHP
jgi:hypothetical protein